MLGLKLNHDSKRGHWEKQQYYQNLIFELIIAHLPLVPYICVGELDEHWSGNDLSPIRRQAITLSIGPLGTNFSEIWMEIHFFHSWICIWKCRLRKWRLFCPEGNEVQLAKELAVKEHHQWVITWANVDPDPYGVTRPQWVKFSHGFVVYCFVVVLLWVTSGFLYYDDVIKWKHFPRYWPFVWGIHRPVNSPHKGQWRGALMISFICARINGWVNNRKDGDLRRHYAHYDVTVMISFLHIYQECFTGALEIYGHFMTWN